jgi:hypothetical protein
MQNALRPRWRLPRAGPLGAVIGGLKPGQAFVLFPEKEGEGADAAAGYLSPLRTALIDRNHGHVNVVVRESDYRALKRGIENLLPRVQ